MRPGEEFWNSINDEASDESDSQKGDFPETGMEAGHVNYEILPIQELKKRAQLLNIENWENLNKQKLIEEIRNHLPK
jgi:hypothetical protein